MCVFRSPLGKNTATPESDTHTIAEGPELRVFHVHSVASYCSFTDTPHHCEQTSCCHRGINAANQPENKTEKLSQKATQPII